MRMENPLFRKMGNKRFKSVKWKRKHRPKPVNPNTVTALKEDR